jgi:glycosyltransferase involved in cell wall biosynthesis
MGGTLRITQVVFDLDGGGLETLVGEMVSGCCAAGISNSIITLSGRLGRVGAMLRPLVEQFLTLRPVPGLSMVAPIGLAHAIRSTRPDVVHLHSGAWLKPALAARLAGVPRIVYTEHGREHDDSAFLRWLDRRAARRTTVVVAVSDRLARYLERDVGIDPKRISTIPNGVDANRFAPGPAPTALRGELGIPARARVIGSIGRLEAVKAYERLLHAFALLRRTADIEDGVFLVLCGDGSRREALMRQAGELGVSDTVRFVGWTDRASDFYRLFDVFALTSLSEGASVSLMEAMSSGAVPAVTNVGANAEVLGPELAEQVIGDWDAEAFARILRRTIGVDGRRDPLGAAARRRILEHYTLEGMLSAYERLYRGTHLTRTGRS